MKELQDLPIGQDGIILVDNILEYNRENFLMEMFLDEMYDKKSNVYFYASQHKQQRYPVVEQFLGGYNLQVEKGDVCRLCFKMVLGYPSDSGDAEYEYPVFLLWEGVVNESILRSAAVRIGNIHPRVVLTEKKKPVL